MREEVMRQPYIPEDKNGNLKTSQFVSWMLVFMGLFLGFFYWASGGLDKRISSMEEYHIGAGNRLTALETKNPEIERRLGNIETGQASMVNILGEILRNVKQNLKQ